MWMKRDIGGIGSIILQNKCLLYPSVCYNLLKESHERKFDENHVRIGMLVRTYEKDDQNPELVLYKKR